MRADAPEQTRARHRRLPAVAKPVFEFAPPFEADDRVRLAALAEYDILDTPAEQGFEDLTLLASRICDTPVALVSLVDRDRQWFKARVGFPCGETDLNSSVCKFVLAEPDVLVIPDLTQDPRTNANPLVTGEPFIRFYAGVSLRTPEGVPIGSLCVIDTKPRPIGLTEGQQETLRALARQVITLLHLRRKSVTQARAAEVLRENEARLTGALNIAQLGTFQWMLMTNAILMDRRAREIFGFAEDDEIYAKNMFDRIHPGDLSTVHAMAMTRMATAEPIEIGYRIQFAEGEIRNVLTQGEFLCGSDGKAERMVGVIADATERVQADMSLRASEARMRAMVDQSSAGIAQTTLNGRFTFVNDRYCSMLGRSREELLTLRMHDLTHPDNLPGNAQQFQNLAQGGSSFELEKRYLRPDGSTIWVHNSVTGVRNEGGRIEGILAVSLDISEQKSAAVRQAEAEAALRHANDTLEQRIATALSEREKIEETLRQSQKMEAVGQLTGGLAHDFNNLLAGISGSLELMQTRMQQGRFTDIERYIAVAQGASKRAAALTHRLLAFSRRQTLDPKPTDVNRLVNGMQEMLQRTVGPSILVEVVGASALWPALVDPPQLENALLNLCINARDAMPDGGRLTIETCNKWLDERASRKLNMAEGQYLSLCVTDTGTGMSSEVIAHVFEPFFTTKPIGEGTGLGLSMVYGFAQQSGGQVRIYSEVGQGSTICIYLPRHSGEVDDEDQTPKLTASPDLKREATVLVVDDEPTVRMLVTDILEDLGYTAIEAGDSAAGLKVLQSDVRIDLLVSDVGLPGGMNGRQMADAGRVKRPDLKVLFITGYAENAVLGHGHLAPGMAVLTKPFAMDAMAIRIRSLIEADKDAKR